MKLYWVVESRGIDQKKRPNGEDTSTIMTSYQDSYPNCELSNIKSWRIQSVSREENENQANGQGMKFVSVIVKIKLAYIKKCSLLMIF